MSLWRREFDTLRTRFVTQTADLHSILCFTTQKGTERFPYDSALSRIFIQFGSDEPNNPLRFRFGGRPLAAKIGGVTGSETRPSSGEEGELHRVQMFLGPQENYQQFHSMAGAAGRALLGVGSAVRAGLQVPPHLSARQSLIEPMREKQRNGAVRWYRPYGARGGHLFWVDFIHALAWASPEHSALHTFRMTGGERKGIWRWREDDPSATWFYSELSVDLFTASMLAIDALVAAAEGGDDGEIYFSPAECLVRLPLDGLLERQKRYQLDKLRQRFPWLRKNASGHLHGKDFLGVISFLKRQSGRTRDISTSIAAMPADPTPEQIENIKRQIREAKEEARRSS